MFALLRYETGGAAGALQECVIEMERQQAQAEEKELAAEELAKKTDTLRKQLANAKVSRHILPIPQAVTVFCYQVQMAPG